MVLPDLAVGEGGVRRIGGDDGMCGGARFRFLFRGKRSLTRLSAE
jgi:hypothetical protein